MTDLQFVQATVLPTQSELDQAEVQFGYPLPNDYREFLATINGGSPTKYFVVRIEDCKDDVLIHYFLSLGQDIDIVQEAKSFEDDLPNGFIIIAADPGGNRFLMNLEDGEPTSIYYWDRVRHFRQSKKKANTYEIASSFTEFLGMLRLMPDA